MGISWANILRLGFKELRSLRRDPVLLALILYAFTYGVYKVATGEKFEVYQAAVAIVDEDRSQLSRRIAAAILEPTFKAPVAIEADRIDSAMDRGEFVFVLEIPPDFESDVLSGRKPTLQIDVDATARYRRRGIKTLSSISGGRDCDDTYALIIFRLLSAQ